MRVLFTSVPAYGHLLPLLPLARAARQAGDDVVVSTHTALASAVGDLPFAAAGPSLSELMTASARRNGVDAIGDLANPRPIVDLFTGLRVDLTLDDALAVARRHHPDVIVADLTDFVAPLVASRLSLPLVTHGISVALPPDLEAGFAAGLTCRFRDFGLIQGGPLARVEPWPSWLQPDDYVEPVGVIPIRPEPHRDSTAIPFVPTFPGRENLPTVLLTFGTVVDDRRALATALDALLQLDVNVIVTTGPTADPESIEAPRDRVRVTGFVPLDQLLTNVSVVVAAGGAGTVLAALSRGLPLVLLPMFADQPLVAEQVISYGAAIGCTSADTLGSAVATVLVDEDYRKAAQRAAEHLAMASRPAGVWNQIKAQFPLTAHAGSRIERMYLA